MNDFLWVGLGGGIGSMLRYGISLLMKLLGFSTTIGTLLVNSLGSLCIGFLLTTCRSNNYYLLLIVGLCGGFTTFSTFSAQSMELFKSGEWGNGLIYILEMLGLCLICAWIGIFSGNKFNA